MAKNMVDLLGIYVNEYKPNYWLFEGPGRAQYSLSSINNIIKAAAHKAGIEMNMSSHVLRHSFATHLLEDGVDIRVIQVLLGHAKLNNTALYTKVATRTVRSVTSPLDRLGLFKTEASPLSD